MEEHVIVISAADGIARGIKSPLTEDMGLTNFTRVSHVEPVNRLLRVLFHAARSRVSDDSLTAAFTRKWPCKWQANIFNGPTLGPFQRRSYAINAEIAYINLEMEKTNVEQSIAV